jgi:hypothetical protein
VIECLAIVATFHFVCFTLLFFSSGVRGALDILHALGGQWGVTGGAGSPRSGRLLPIILAVSLVLTLWVLWKKNVVIPLLDRVGQRLTRRTQSLRLLVVGETVLVVFLLVFFWALNQKDPVVVYMRF